MYNNVFRLRLRKLCRKSVVKGLLNIVTSMQWINVTIVSFKIKYSFYFLFYRNCYLNYGRESSWSWTYCSWIYNYSCN